jgi:hypothetical protein
LRWARKRIQIFISDCAIVIKIVIHRQILVKGPNIVLHENSLIGSRIITWGTDKYDENTVIFLEHFIANAPRKIHSDFHLDFDYSLTCPTMHNMGEGVGHVTNLCKGDITVLLKYNKVFQQTIISLSFVPKAST